MTKRVTATKSKQTRSKTEKVAIGSGNVFADLGFEDSEERLLKAKLATKIAQLIEPKPKRPNGLDWTNRKFLDFCAANSLAFQPIVYSRF